MTPIDLRAIEGRCERATKGPCEAHLGDDGLWRMRFPKIPRGFHGGAYGYLTYASEDDAQFDAHARTDVPALVQAVRERDEEIERLRAAIERLERGIGESMSAQYDTHKSTDGLLASALSDSRKVLEGRG